MNTRQKGSSIQRLDLKSGPRWVFRLDLGRNADGERQQRTKTFKTEGEAVAEQARLRTSVATQTYVDPSRLTLNAHLDNWLATGRRGWKPSTFASYRIAVQPARRALGTKALQKVTRPDIEGLVNAMLATGGQGGRGRSPRTVALLLTLLNTAFKEAAADSLIARNPAEHVRKPSGQHNEMQVWSAEQVRTFLGAVEDDALVGAWHLTMRGLRRGEVVGLRWCDVDFDKAVLHVRQTRVAAGSLGVVTGAPKTARGRRTLPMDPELLRTLRLTHERTVSAATVVPLRQRGTGDGERLVVVDALGEPLRPEVYGDKFARIAKAAGLPPIRLHDARHTVLSLMLEQGVPVHIVAAWAGHNPAVTLTTYAHASDVGTRAAGEALSTLFAARL